MIEQTLKAGQQNRIQLRQTDTVTVQLTLLHENGDPIDLTALTVKLQSKLSLWDSAAAFTITGTLVDADAGIVSFAFTETLHTANVREYWADIISDQGAGSTLVLMPLFNLSVIRGISL